MTLALRITAIVLCVLFAAYAVRLITAGRLLLRYALIWFAFVVITLLCVLFPEPLFWLSGVLGFKTASNFVLFIGLLFTLVIVLSLTVVVSRLSRYVTSLVQENAVLKHKVESIAETADKPKCGESDAAEEGLRHDV